MKTFLEGLFGKFTPRESARRIALDLAVRAADLASWISNPDQWRHLTTPQILLATRESLSVAAKRSQDQERTILALRTELAFLEETAKTRDEAIAAPHPIVGELIDVADRLGGLENSAVTEWLGGRIAGMLDRCEVAPIRDAGPVDPARHEVVDARATRNDRDIEHIADTVRPGYMWHGRVIRPQQVVAYVREDARES